MLKTAATKLKHLLKVIKEGGIQWHRRKLARLAKIEARERRALVNELIKKFEVARADCEQNDKTSTAIEFSVQEIIFIEGDLKTWNRYFKEREIYEPLLNKHRLTPP